MTSLNRKIQLMNKLILLCNFYCYHKKQIVFSFDSLLIQNHNAEPAWFSIRHTIHINYSSILQNVFDVWIVYFNVWLSTIRVTSMHICNAFSSNIFYSIFYWHLNCIPSKRSETRDVVSVFEIVFAFCLLFFSCSDKNYKNSTEYFVLHSFFIHRMRMVYFLVRNEHGRMDLLVK